MLSEFEPVAAGPLEESRLCSQEGCETQAVVGNPYTGAYKPLCFYHAFVAALDEDPEAQKLAIGWAVAEGFSDRNVSRRRG